MSRMVLVLIAVLACSAGAQVYNLKVVTDASPDYSDMESLIRSATGAWQTPEEKCWAIFYWNHIARRQTSPAILHGLELTDPIRQFNDYGYTMCSTIAGINCSIWDAMGFPIKYWDISLHTVPEVFYAGRWHMYDNSMSAIYTLCDGKTIAGVEDIGKEGACEATGGKPEPGHIARRHCLNATGPDGFLTGADCERSLASEHVCFNPNGLKYRYYFHDWDRGHRTILNLREGETYTRYYYLLGKEPQYYIPNNGRDPEVNDYGGFRFRIRGNGVWRYAPRPRGGIYKIEGANVITSLRIRAAFHRAGEADLNRIAVSTTNGLAWREVWKNEKTGATRIDLLVVDEVNGAYEVLVAVALEGKASPDDARLDEIAFETTTMLNSKTQPKLLLGRNTVYVGAGEQTGSIVFWPDLRGDAWKPYAVDARNVATQKEHPGYMGAMHAEKPNEEAYVVFRIDSPHDIARVTYGGRLYNRAPKAHIDFLHSFDGGKSWTKTYSLTETKPPWDVIHYETVADIPTGTRSVLFKYLWNASEAGPSAASIYALRMEANTRAPAAFKPIDVTLTWDEVQADRSRIERSHTERVTRIPYRYPVCVGGADHPIVKSLRVGLEGAVPDVKLGYSDGRDAGGEKFVGRWVTYGKNLAEGKPYTVSIPSGDNWGAGDPEGKKLTDGIVGPPYGSGAVARHGLCWTEGKEPVVTVDLGTSVRAGAFRIQLSGYPDWDALKGEVKDEVEVLTSLDGQRYESRGAFDLSLRWKDLPANHMWPDEERIMGHNFEKILPEPIETRYVRFRIRAARFLFVSEVQVLDRIEYRPFDLRIALP